MLDTSIRLIVLDLGNVLLSFDMKPFCEWASHLSGKTPEAIQQRYAAGPIKAAYERGDCDEEKFFREMASWLECGHKAIPALQQAWSDVFAEIPGARDGMDRLMTRFPVWVFSDTNPTHLRHFRARFPWVFAGERFIPSSESHALKNEPGAFEFLTALARLRPDEILFFDDLPENVQRATACGLRAVLFRDWPAVLRHLKM